ncbi:vWA domain-containing protein [Corallococcus macrosporus]|uniref:von Willebrand factor type A domain-containing protein n=1 Tax=Myxococcus fulvus (strain ATCC BAA-855 / HW-1) TaxID=483219 RepID=F8CCW0_MYXFH|nr:VWA domain-containing protein [Corallococcus macrosporus]AEI63467.1 von Willebrand factor type A domain-containing protein [Corallococcus macrosporus]
MNRTLLLVAATGVLAVGALLLGTPPEPPAPPPPVVTDTSHTVRRAEDPPATRTLPLVTSRPEDGALSMAGKLSGAYVQTGPSEAFAWLELKARPAEAGQRVPVNLALVLDRSGSMNGKKLEDARRAAAELVRRLTPEDRLAFIDYGTDVRVQPSRRMTDEARAELLALISELRDEGSTNISGALDSAASALRPHLREYRVSRAILLSDGQPTTGIVSEPGLLDQVARLRRDGITVSALGVGRDYQETLMRGMAEQGGGFSGFIDDSERLAEVFSRELDQATRTVARLVELRLDVPPEVRHLEVMGMASFREGNVLKVPLYDMAGAQTVRVVAKLTLDTGKASGTLALLNARLHYVDVARDLPADTALRLTAEVTGDAARVREHLDKEVRVHAVRALGTQQMVAAAEEMKRGNKVKARGLLDNARAIFGSSAEALSGELADVSRSQAALAGASSAEETQAESRNLLKKSIRNFGQNNTY